MKSKIATALIASAALAMVASAAHAALKVGDAAPQFTGKGGLEGKPIDFTLAQALKKGPVVLYFFPARLHLGLHQGSARLRRGHS